MSTEPRGAAVVNYNVLTGLLCLTLNHVSAQAQTAVTTTDTRASAHVQTPHADAQTLAREWGLDATEYTRYEHLMRGPRGAFSQANISPLEVLGIHAQTPAERRAYADRLVKLLFEDTERVLAFEREVQSAWQRLGQPVFDPARLPTKAIRTSLDVNTLWGQRLAVFVSTQDCPRCAPETEALVRLTDSGGPLIGLDVYAVDTEDAAAIREFARSAGIVPDAVQRRRITLNPGATLFAQFQGQDRTLPKMFLRQDGRLHPLADARTIAR